MDGSQTTSKGVNSTLLNAAVSLDWTIFSGFYAQANYKKLNELKQIGALSTQISVENLIADIVVGYSNYMQQIQVLEQSEICCFSFKRTSENR